MIWSQYLIIGSLGKDKSSKDDNEFDLDEKEKDDIEVLLARKLSRGKGKLKGKLPLICFKCKEVGNIESRCPNTRKSDKIERRDKKI